jgi:hypothetical protein
MSDKTHLVDFLVKNGLKIRSIFALNMVSEEMQMQEKVKNGVDVKPEFQLFLYMVKIKNQLLNN